MIIIVFGLPGSGKTYFAYRLAALLPAAYVSSDQLRKDIAGTPTYSDKEKESVYLAMLEEMKEAIKENRDLVLDATFYKQQLRQEFIYEALLADTISFIEVTAPEKLIKQRLQQDRVDSDANFDVYQLLKEDWEPMDEPHLVLHSGIDNIEYMLDTTMANLHLTNDKTTD